MTDVRAKRREERVKLFASALSNVGSAAIATGIIAPAVAQHLKPTVAIGATMLGFGAHLVAQCILHYVVADPPDGDAGGSL